MEAKSQQNFYNKAAIVVISLKLTLWSIHFQDLVQKVTKWLTIIHYFQFMLLAGCFVALRPKSTAMVIAGRSVHLTTLFPGQA